MVRAQERIEDLASTSLVGPIGADSDVRIDQLITDSKELSEEGIQILKLVAESNVAREAGAFMGSNNINDLKPSDMVECVIDGCNKDTCDNSCLNHKMEWGFSLPSCHLKRGVEGEGEKTVSNSETVTISSEINKDKGNDSTSKEAAETSKDGDGLPAIHKDKAIELKRRPFVRVCVEVKATDELPEIFSVEIDESYTIQQQIQTVEKVNKVWKAKEKESIHANGEEEGNSFAPLANLSTNEHRLPLDKELAQPEKEKAKTREQLDDDVEAITHKTPIGGDYVDEGFQPSKSALKSLRKKNNKSEKVMRAAEVQEPPSRQKYFNRQGMELEASSPFKPKSSTASGRLERVALDEMLAIKMSWSHFKPPWMRYSASYKVECMLVTAPLYLFLGSGVLPNKQASYANYYVRLSLQNPSKLSECGLVTMEKLVVELLMSSLETTGLGSGLVSPKRSATFFNILATYNKRVVTNLVTDVADCYDKMLSRRITLSEDRAEMRVTTYLKDCMSMDGTGQICIAGHQTGWYMFYPWSTSSIVKATFSTMVSYIGMERNLKYFDNKIINPKSTLTAICAEICTRLEFVFGGIVKTEKVKDLCTKWKVQATVRKKNRIACKWNPPPPGVILLNTDGALNETG
ncbi:hypothetical protein GIB67_010297 [Kingdonia uniflora]|uniref:Uncharacterized protein n=1 Tax=Kingdonia uniflora TaxID=39325 RepID=A0A7J7LCW9_9MAGN|nr:hypothetical protein GIB67_010297 [Kingdonia uniflora]